MEYYNVRVLPLVKYIEVERNGKKVHCQVDNLTKEEKQAMSIKPAMYWQFDGEAWLAERPLFVRFSGGVMDRLFYLYDDLTEEEKEKYKDRTIEMRLTRPKVTKVYKTKKKVKSNI